MNARKIATSVPARQYDALEKTRKRLGLGRSAAVQEALALWLSARGTDARVEQYLRGYLTHPDDAAEAQAAVEAWSTGMAGEDWGEPRRR